MKILSWKKESKTSVRYALLNSIGSERGESTIPTRSIFGREPSKNATVQIRINLSHVSGLWEERPSLTFEQRAATTNNRRQTNADEGAMQTLERASTVRGWEEPMAAVAGGWNLRSPHDSIADFWRAIGLSPFSLDSLSSWLRVSVSVLTCIVSFILCDVAFWMRAHTAPSSSSSLFLSLLATIKSRRVTYSLGIYRGSDTSRRCFSEWENGCISGFIK